VVKAPAPAPAPAVKITPPAPQPAKPAQPAPAAKVTPPAPQPTKPAAQPAPAAKVTPPTPQPAKPTPQPAPATKAPAPAPTKVSQPAAEKPAAAKKKAPIGAIVGIIAVVAIAGAAFLFVQNNKAKEQARLAAVEQAAAAQREADAKKAAEAKKIADEQRAATERELARLRKEADEAKRKASEEADKRRIYEETLARAPGLIKINTNPEGAEVSVDGATPQVTPAIITEVAPGLRRVTVRLAGYETVEQLAEVKNTQALDLGTITLQRVYGELMLRSEPADAEFAVYENDKLDAPPLRTGRTPGRVDNLLPGEYVIKFNRQGLLPTTEHATITGKEVIDVNSTFIVGGVSITSNPVGATVRMNGENLGITPIVRPELLPGRATFEFTLPNHEPLKLTGEITSKDTLRLHAEMLHVDRIARMSEVKSPPRVLEKATPEIPGDLGEIKGEVVISLVVTKQGTIRDIRVDKSTNPALTEPCLKAINQWKFGPAISKAGLPVNMRIAIPIPIDIKAQQQTNDRPLGFSN
jgi:TonB family protein